MSKIRNRPPAYIRLINSQRWVKLRRSYLSRHPLCERCLELGKTQAAQVVHHIDPLENYLSMPNTMERLAYDPNNLKALCNECHGAVHRELGSRQNKFIRQGNHWNFYCSQIGKGCFPHVENFVSSFGKVCIAFACYETLQKF